MKSAICLCHPASLIALTEVLMICQSLCSCLAEPSRSSGCDQSFFFSFANCVCFHKHARGYPFDWHGKPALSANVLMVAIVLWTGKTCSISVQQCILKFEIVQQSTVLCALARFGKNLNSNGVGRGFFCS